MADKVVFAQTLWKRFVGLLGKKGLGEGEALVIRPCSAIHTFFMRFSIDVLFLDKNKQVIKAIQNMPPNRFSSIVWTSQMVIELPAGKISQTDTRIGDIIKFK